jgi:hypothetical protein
MRKRAGLLVAALLAGTSITACAAIWGFQDSLDGGGDSSAGDGGRPDGSRDSGGSGGDGGGDAYDAPVIVDAPPPSDAPVAQPCAATAPETYAYYVAEHGGMDNSTCGTLSFPCQSIHAAIHNAMGIATIVNVAEGSYDEQLVPFAGLTVVGGWLYGEGKWARDTSSDAPTRLVVQPTTESITVVASSLTGKPATLCTLTLESKSANAGETLYGVFATGGSSLVLSDVDIKMGPGGNGAAGSTGDAGTAGDKGGCLPAGTGLVGSPSGPAGMPGVAGTFDETGYEPGNGGVGGPGVEGTNGTAAPTPSCINCVSCAAPIVLCDKTTTSSPCGLDGTPGCAGGPGGPGGGAGGGGSSVCVFAWQATVTIEGSELIVGSGGDGADGGAGGGGGIGAKGVTGASGTTCDTTCNSSCVPATPETPLGSTGGTGGSGSSGGPGGGGSGGFSCPIVTGGDGGVTVKSTTIAPGKAGSGANGAPAGGIGNDAGVCSF